MLEKASEEFEASNMNLSENIVCQLDVTGLGLSHEELAFLCTSDEYFSNQQRQKYDMLLKKKMDEYDELVEDLGSNYEISLAIHDKLIKDVGYAYADGGWPSDEPSAHSSVGM